MIHGGDSFSSYKTYLDSLKTKELDYERLKPQKKWKSWVADQMPDADVLLPTLPNGYNAVYDEWCIYFEKLIPFFKDDVRLVGHSLGAMFLTKYLHNHHLPHKVSQLILVAGQYGKRAGDDLGSFIVSSAKNIDQSAEEIHLFYSKDDPVVDYASIHDYHADLPEAILHSFSDKGHFLDPEFPELLAVLQQK